MPAYNAAKHLRSAVASVCAQTHRHWILFIVDDCSEDETAAIAMPLAEADGRIRYVRMQQRSGAAAARNVAIRQAQTRYIAFLDADDLWAPEKLARQLAFAQERQAALTFTGYWRGREGGKWRYVPAKDRVSYADLSWGNSIGCLTVLYDRLAFPPVEMPLLKRRNDYGFWLRLLKETPYGFGLDEGLAGYRRGSGDTLSGSFLTAQRSNWHFFRRHLELPPLSASARLATHAGKKAWWSLSSPSKAAPYPWLEPSSRESGET